MRLTANEYFNLVFLVSRAIGVNGSTLSRFQKEFAISYID
jgi:hypothetical protein